MNDIIKIDDKEIGGNTIQTVNARDLHAFLEVKSRFNDWINNKIKQGFFLEGKDFITLTKNLVNGGKQNNYHISLTMAKKIGMMESSEKGNEVRDYFIECERRAKQVVPALPQNYLEALKCLIVAEEQKQLLQIENQKKDALLVEQAPKVEFHDAVEAAENSIPIGVFAKLLAIAGLGRNNLFAWFRDNGYIGKRGREHNVARQAYVKQGLFEVVEKAITKPSGEDFIIYTTLITGKGQIYFEKKLRGEFVV